MDDFIEFMQIGVMLGLGVLGVLAVIIGVVAGIDYADCSGFTKGTGIQTKWAWGCYAQVDGEWVPKSYVFGDAHELRIKARSEAANSTAK